jgi:hypothetical protein
LGRGASIAAGPFPQTARRTRRAAFTATGSPWFLPWVGSPNGEAWPASPIPAAAHPPGRVGWCVTIRWRIFRHYSLQLSPHPSRTSRNHCRPSPCDRLSRPPRQVVTPATTTAAPPHPRPIGRRCAQPNRPRWLRSGGQTRGGSRVHLLIARRRRHPTRPLRHRRGYPAARHPGLPSVPPTCRGVPRPP